ncbi:hypothetical protein JCM10207_003588 [Rhodosporidiobolus poonsookiae]
MLRSVASRLVRSSTRTARQARPAALPRRALPPSHSQLRAFSATPLRLQASQQTWPIVKDDWKTLPYLTLQVPTGPETKLSYMWLRDHCREDRSYHPKTKQRLVDTYQIPEKIRPDAVEAKEDGLYVTWPESSFETSYTSFYPWSFLVEFSHNPPLVKRNEARPGRMQKIEWSNTVSRRLPNLPPITYDSVMESDKGVYDWLKRIDIYGFALVSGIPPTPEATEQLIRRIAFIRVTHYGGFWDFTANLEHGDLAYSDVRLEGHTDTTYFTDPCGLQLFHLLSPKDTHTGGDNLLIDGFRAAHLLKLRNPRAYEFLSEVATPSHASGSGSASLPSGVHMRPLRSFPVFSHNEYGELVMVRWNSEDRATLGGQGMKGKLPDRWYTAARAFEKILRSDEAQLWTPMEPGTAVIFDNHRVLHGRSAFSGSRRLCGAYISGDDYRSRLRGLERQYGSVEDGSTWHLERQGVATAMERFGIAQTKGAGAEKGGAWEDYL